MIYKIINTIGDSILNGILSVYINAAIIKKASPKFIGSIGVRYWNNIGSNKILSIKHLEILSGYNVIIILP